VHEPSARIVLALVCGALLAVGCQSDEARAREAWSASVDITRVDALGAATARVDELSDEVRRELEHRNFGKARSAAVTLAEEARLVSRYWVPLTDAKHALGHAFNLLAMGESEKALEPLEHATKRVAAAREHAPTEKQERYLGVIERDLTQIPSRLPAGANVARFRVEENAGKIGRLLADSGPPPISGR